jgi:hypothetical protein
MASSVNKWLKTAIVALLVLTGAGFSSGPLNTSFGRSFHPLFISVTEMEYNATDKTLEISCKVFTDDFEKGLAKATDTRVDIYNPKDKAVLGKQIAAYISRHLQVKTDGKLLNLEYVGYELEEQSTWSFFQVNKLATAPQKVEVTNNIFYEMYDKQINIIHFTSGGVRKSTKLDYPATVATFEF